MKKVKVPNVKKGFSVINNELCEVTLLRVFVDFKDDINNTLVVKHQGSEHTVSQKNFYETVDTFHKGTPVAWNDDVWFHWFVQGIMFTDGASSCYTFENGEPVYHEFSILSVLVTFNEEGMVTGVESKDFPANSFQTREDCLAYNDVIVSHEDGTTELRRGIAKMAMLSDEQRALVDEIFSLIRKAYDTGVRINTDWNHTYAFNIKGFSKWSIEYENPFEGGEMINLNRDEFIVKDSRLSTSGEEENLYIKR